MEGKSQFSRSEALLGAVTMERLAMAHALVVGVGGVGSWCAEALVRTGLGHITLVDDDAVVESNLNRQCPATMATLGKPKVEAMKERLLAINPECEVESRQERLERPEGLEAFDMIVDAIDSVDCKAELILAATAAGVPIVSSMGAARRMDPTKVCVTRFEKVEGDGLARALRQRFKRMGRFPERKFMCVWSMERPKAGTLNAATGMSLPHDALPHDALPHKGSLMMVTATFGMCLASEALREMVESWS